ncbi:hypothetical protein QCA50_011837 [Cerrena zonata]|uniref:NADH:flavin oxidoreductase/NADH oxidase N-terminal domain-containing protein n=1 Tax=Cerrena zonata TaxID=2478898 RepID=A0AAW0G5Q8_9APHY
MAASKLFQPTKIGDLKLEHRVVLAPLTRFRGTAEHVHTDLGVEHYRQRASSPGTLLITEGTFITGKAGGYAHVPSIETDEQLAAWKKVTDAVHEKKSFIFAQLWALGRTADPKVLESEGFELVGPSDIPAAGKSTPRPLTTEEVKEYVQFYAKAADNAVHRAGFDGIELHSANGYLLNQFLHETVNNRTDEYGGSIENRVRFVLEVLEASVKAVGASKVGIRFSPWEFFNDIRINDPIPLYTHLVTRIREQFPDLAYIHVTEPRVSGDTPRDPKGESNDFIRAIWSPRPLISAGGYGRDLAIEWADTKGDIIAFGRHFIANPDLPRRLKENIPLNAYDRSTFYSPLSPKGYIDYPFADESKL